jgi:sporulation protein YlmC with PRC-barrel domain
MKRMFLVISVAALAATGVSAQEADPGSQPKASAQPALAETPTAAPAPAAKTQLSPFNKASTFLGSAVQSPNGKPLGKVADVVFDLDRGELAYAVIALEAGNGNTRQVAVPVRALKPAAAYLVLNLSEHILAAAEGLQEGNWPGTEVFAVGRPAQAESGTARSTTDSPQK